MGRERYVVRLEREERDQLERLIRGGKSPARKVARARILLKADTGWGVMRIVEALDTSAGTVCRTKRRYLEGGLKRALEEDPRPGHPTKLDERGEAHLIALACSEAPPGHDHWTLRLLANKVVELGLAPSMSHEGIRKPVEKNSLKPWQKKEWCIPQVSAEFVACMEDVLDLYAEPYDPERPVVCFDETSKQLLAEKRSPIPPKPARRERYDYEYQRNGTRNLFMLCEPLAGWRHVAVTERRTMVDFAQQMRWLADEAYPASEKIRVVLDNLNTHKPASLYETFEPKEARRIRKRLEFHYTPKHGSWLNMAEIEFSVLARRVLRRRIADEETLSGEIAALEAERNQAGATIDWRFSTVDARVKLHHLYPANN